MRIIGGNISTVLNLSRKFTSPDVTSLSFSHSHHLYCYQPYLSVLYSGTIDLDEIKLVLKTLGETLSTAQLKSMIAEVDLDGTGDINFGEFATLVHKMRSGDTKSAFANVVTKSAKLFESHSASGGKHAFSEAEAKAFTEHINNCLSSDDDLPYVPLDVDRLELFGACRDGLMLCKLINKAVADTIDVRALNIPKKGKSLNIYQIQENQRLCINAAKAIGCVVVNVGSNDLIEGTPHIILGIVWQIVKIQLLSLIDLKHHPELVLLLEEGEELEDLLALPPQV